MPVVINPWKISVKINKKNWIQVTEFITVDGQPFLLAELFVSGSSFVELKISSDTEPFRYQTHHTHNGIFTQLHSLLPDCWVVQKLGAMTGWVKI